MNELSLMEQVQSIISKYGEWSYDIPFSPDIWTRGNKNIPHTRLKRVLQISADTVGKPLSDCRVLDLGCLDGIFSIEFALQGAETLGIEIREDNVERANFSKEVLRLSNLEFVKDDARNISPKKYGIFDIILCSGLLYHLNSDDAIKLVHQMHKMTNRLLVIDTHIALKPEVSHKTEKYNYWGKIHIEHNANDSQSIKSKRRLASWDNETSFWFTRPSLINLLRHSGFSSVYECFNPPHLNFGKEGLEHFDRCTFVAIKGSNILLNTSPSANNIDENWPENTLNYGVYQKQTKKQKKIIIAFLKKILSKIKRVIKS